MFAFVSVHFIVRIPVHYRQGGLHQDARNVAVNVQDMYTPKLLRLPRDLLYDATCVLTTHHTRSPYDGTCHTTLDPPMVAHVTPH